MGIRGCFEVPPRYNLAFVTGHPQGRVLLCLAGAELLAMSLWFTGTAVLPQLARQWQAGLDVTSWLTIAVQLGFVAGALVIAVFNLSDVFAPTRVFAVSSVAAAAANALFAAVAGRHVALAIALRFLTGAFLAGVYPTGMKLVAGWFRQGRGLALGVLIGALTVGSALPHGVRALGELDWRAVVLSSSVFALLAAALVAFGVHEGPYATASPPFRFTQIGEALRNPRLRLANLGYLGHMWELYSMWGWIAVLLAAAGTSYSRSLVELAAFAAIAIGALGCVWAGRASDGRAGDPYEGHAHLCRRARVTIVAMTSSGACCLLAAAVFHHFALLVVVALLWGIAVIADSAQFSAIVSEVSNWHYVGTALTTQVALGFLLTAISQRAVAALAANYGWRWAAASLAVGPALGILAMRRLMALSAETQQEDERVAAPASSSAELES